jgi:SAM-dependent methyltransferase
VNPSPVSALEAALARLVRCPRCRTPLELQGDRIVCSGASCGFCGRLRDGVVMLQPEAEHGSEFDAAFEIMQQTSAHPGVRRLCYAQQAASLEASVAPSSVVLDVGCGPALPYRRDPRWFVVGLERSFESLRRNADVDLRIHGSATALPLADRSIDAIVCFYSIHHMVGATVAQNRALVNAAFQEFGRVLKPHGELFVFELAPLWPVWQLERALWNLVRRAHPAVNMFFWSAPSLLQIASAILPAGTTYKRRRYAVPPWIVFPPIFTLPQLLAPRFLFPFLLYCYHWRLAGRHGSSAPGVIGEGR